MTTLLRRMMMTVPVLTAAVAVNAASPLEMEFDDGVDAWRIVVDGVMGGRSSGRVSLSEPGILQFTGNLSLENNGGFSQMRTNVGGEGFVGADGIELKVRGDGRTYKFDVRCSNVRLMAGGFQQDFKTEAGEWTTIRLPFGDFRLYSFGRRVPNAPALEPAMIESVGVTLADKKAGAFRLEVDSIRAYGDQTSSAESKGADLASVAGDAGLTTLMELVAAAELEFPESERLTVFAPTDEAFAALPESTVRDLVSPEGRETLLAILTYHVAVPAMTSADLLSRRSIPTLNGQRLTIDSSGPISIGESEVIAVDVPFDGGVVHVIDAVLMPSLKSIGELAAASSDLGTLTAAVSAAGLGDQLNSENGPWTVFAPVDAAFGELPEGTLDEMLRPENRTQLTDILGLHVVPGRLYANELLTSRRARTLYGESIEFSIENGRILAGEGGIIGADIEAGNGVIHLIDTVLLPAESETISASKSTEAARLCELAINRGAPLFNNGQTAACASIYEVTIEAMISLGAESLGRDVLQRLEMGLAEADTEHNSSARAWAYRRALDDAYARLRHQAEPAAATVSR